MLQKHLRQFSLLTAELIALFEQLHAAFIFSGEKGSKYGLQFIIDKSPDVLFFFHAGYEVENGLKELAVLVGEGDGDGFVEAVELGGVLGDL
jgi:hypothetical protein